MGCWFSDRKDPNVLTNLNDIQLDVRKTGKDGPVLSESKNIALTERRPIRFFHCLDGIDQGRQKALPTGEKIFVAIYDYDARTDEDLTFRVGDLLYIIDDRFVSLVGSSRCIFCF